MRKGKRSVAFVISMILVLSMCLGVIAYAEEVVETEHFHNLKALVRQSGEVQHKADKIDKDLSELALKEDEPVRIVVELNDAPIIERATEQGIKVNELKASEVESLTEELLDSQEEVIEEFEDNALKVEVHKQFTNVLNGFSTTVAYKDIESIAKNEAVKKVYISNEYERPVPQMNTSHILTKSKFVNEEYGYTGEGMVVAVLDTGIDPTHKDLNLDSDAEGRLSSTYINKMIAENGLKGRYFTEKVPYAYNNMDDNYEILDKGEEASMHGMHVAGTVAANKPDGAEEGIDGVAPNAQVLGLKVFGNDPQFPSTFGDIIIAAIDDAIVLGADVMNLSLGSTAAFVDETDPEQQAIARAVDNGILMSISAGNSAYYGNGYDNPYTQNPDIGVVGSPGLSTDSLQVASIDNYLELYETSFVIEEEAIEFYGFGKDKWEDKAYTLIKVGGTGLGAKEDYDSVDVKGKVVLVERGAFSFSDKTVNASEAGAIGIIVYDHGLSRFYKDQGGWAGIPFAKISKSDGTVLVEALAANGGEITIKSAKSSGYMDPAAGAVSSFSSWGTTPSLDFKPEIAAPGGNIYSTFNNDEYGYMSGTSMAAPHVAGGAALVLEKIQKDPIFKNLGVSEEEKVVLAKNILMNTAVPVADKKYSAYWGTAYESVRIQGAGSMNLKNAIDTEVVVVNTETGLGKVNLGEFTSNKQTFDLEIKNYGSKTALYDLSGFVGTNYVEDGYNYLFTMPLQATFTFKEDGKEIEDYLTVEPYETLTLTVTITLDEDELDYVADMYSNGNFIEGFVFLNADEEVYNNVVGKVQKKYEDAATKITETEAEIIEVENKILATEEKVKIAEYDLSNKFENVPATTTTSAAIVTYAKATKDYAGAKIEYEVLIEDQGAKEKEGYNEKLAQSQQNVVTALADKNNAYTVLTVDEKASITNLEKEVELYITEVIKLTINRNMLTYQLHTENILLEELKNNLKAFKEIVTTLQDKYDEVSGTEYALVPVSVPYLGFYGDWSDAEGFDSPKYESDSFYGLTGLLEEKNNAYYFLGFTGNNTYNSEAIAISPNGDGYQDTATPIVSILRNMTDIRYEILNEEGEVIRTIGLEEAYRKNYYDGRNPKYYLHPKNVWDGSVKLKTVADGQYYYRVSGVLEDDDSTVKTVTMPVKVDTVEPVIESVSFSNKGKTMTINATDENSGVYEYIVLDLERNKVLARSYSPEIDFSDIENELYSVAVFVMDNASNLGVYANPVVLNDIKNPEVKLNIEPFSVLATRTFTVTGTVTDVLKPTVMLDGQQVELVYDAIKDGYIFEKDFVYDSDGKKAISITTTDVNGNEIHFLRHFYIDASTPIITSNITDMGFVEDQVNYVDNNIDSFDFKAVVNENFPNIQVIFMGDIIYNKEVDFVSYENLIKPVTYSVEETMELSEGENPIKLMARDVTGATTVLDFMVYRLKEGEEAPNDVVVYNGEKNSQGSDDQSSGNTNTSNDDTANEGTANDNTDNVNNQSTQKPAEVKKSSRENKRIDPPGTVPPTTDDPSIKDELIPRNMQAFSQSPFIAGRSDGTFDPSGNITRAEVCKILAIPLNMEQVTKDTFVDTSNHWAKGYIAAMEERTFINGYSNGEFKPDAGITRAEMATILDNIMLAMNVHVDTTESIYEDVDHWAKDAIARITAYGVYHKKDGKFFRPDDKLTRAEAVVMINQFIKKTVGESNLYEDPSFIDVTKNHWAYEHIEASHR